MHHIPYMNLESSLNARIILCLVNPSLRSLTKHPCIDIRELLNQILLLLKFFPVSQACNDKHSNRAYRKTFYLWGPPYFNINGKNDDLDLSWKGACDLEPSRGTTSHGTFQHTDKLIGFVVTWKLSRNSRRNAPLLLSFGPRLGPVFQDTHTNAHTLPDTAAAAAHSYHVTPPALADENTLVDPATMVNQHLRWHPVIITLQARYVTTSHMTT